MSNHADVDDQMLQDSIHVMRKSVLRKTPNKYEHVYGIQDPWGSSPDVPIS